MHYSLCITGKMVNKLLVLERELIFNMHHPESKKQQKPSDCRRNINRGQQLLPFHHTATLGSKIFAGAVRGEKTQYCSSSGCRVGDLNEGSILTSGNVITGVAESFLKARISILFRRAG